MKNVLNMGNNNKIKESLKNSINTKKHLLSDPNFLSTMNHIISQCVQALKNGNSIYWAGNGGSAADAQHLAAELSGRFYYDRPPLPSDALHCNTSYITAVGNDYGYELIYSRLIRGIGKKGDILIGLSTSGNSENILKAFNVAKKMGMYTIGLTGSNGQKFVDNADVTIKVPSTDTPRIQECHMVIGHTICEIIENEMFPVNE